MYNVQFSQTTETNRNGAVWENQKLSALNKDCSSAIIAGLFLSFFVCIFKMKRIGMRCTLVLFAHPCFVCVVFISFIHHSTFGSTMELFLVLFA